MDKQSSRSDEDRLAMHKLHDRLGAMIDQIGHPDYSLRELVDGLREIRNELMRLSTPVSERPLIPEGWKLVPIEPTAAMLAAYKGALKDMIENLPPERRKHKKPIREPFKGIGRWRAMLAAAPSHERSDS